MSSLTGSVAKFDFGAKSQNLGSGIQWLTDANTLEKATLRQNRGEWIDLDFPVEPEAPVTAPADLVRALGVTPRYVGKNRVDYLAEVDSEEAVHRLQPDLSLLRRLPVRGTIVTALTTTPEYDFVSRFFAPGAGIDETVKIRGRVLK